MAEKLVRLDEARAEADRMRPVYEAAMAYQRQYDHAEYATGEEDIRSHEALLEACRAQEEVVAR